VRDVGVFARYGWSDGKTESWAFTQIDRSISGGISLQGRLWKRKGDNLGVAAVRNYLTGDERRYLAAGGLDFLIGDGRLNYAPESIAEAYYAWQAFRAGRSLSITSASPIRPTIGIAGRFPWGLYACTGSGNVVYTLTTGHGDWRMIE